MENNVDKTSDSKFEYAKLANDAINEATQLEQDGNWAEALKKLETVLREADKLIESRRGAQDEDCATNEEVETLRKKILQHIENCNQELRSHIEAIAPPSYEEAMSTSGSSVSYTTQSSVDGTVTSNEFSYSELGSVLENLKADMGGQSAQLIYSCDDTLLYFISSSGIVTVSSGPETVRIFEIEDGCQESLPKYYLQIYTFVYPLIPQVSPIIKTEFGAILLPNINVEQQGESDVESVGLVVKREKEEEFIATLENILQSKIVHCNTKESESVNITISDKITSGAAFVSNFLIVGAQKASEFLDGNTPRLINNINPATREKRVSPCVSNGIRIARDVTAITASVTGFVASRVGAATMLFGQYLAPHVRRGGAKVLTKTTGMNEDVASNKISAILNVTAGAVEGISTIYEGLELSARIFGRSLSNNTVQVVTHKYGEQAGRFTENTFETVGNSVQIGSNIRFLKPTKIMKETAKGLVVSEARLASGTRNSVSEELTQPSTSGYVPANPTASTVLISEAVQ